MIRVAGHDFPEDTLVVTCDHVHGGAEIGTFSHDHEDEGGLSFQCVGKHIDDIKKAVVICLAHLADRPEIADLPHVCAGQSAERLTDGTWEVYDHGDD